MIANISEAAVKLLKFRAYSQYELKQKLLHQGYDQGAIDQVVEYFTKRGYLNDAALCDMLLSQYAEMKKYSIKESYIKLRRRGLPAALVSEKLRNWTDEFEYRAALNLVQRYLKGHDNQNIPKIIRRLSAKGFRASTVSKVLENLKDMSP